MRRLHYVFGIAGILAATLAQDHTWLAYLAYTLGLIEGLTADLQKSR